MKIASWNINSLRKRQDRLFEWLEATKPDVVCLQETKCSDEQFPALALQAAGYHSAYHGEKSYNGVAILSKTELRSLPEQRLVWVWRLPKRSRKQERLSRWRTSMRTLLGPLRKV